MDGCQLGAIMANIFQNIGNSIFNQPRAKERNVLNKNQQMMEDYIMQALQGEGPLGQIGQYDPATSAQQFNDAVAQPLITQFQEEVMPGITGQFRGAGLGNSTFAGQASARAGEGLERQLASGLAQYQQADKQSALDRLLQLFSTGFGRQTKAFEQPTQSAFESAAYKGLGEAAKGFGGSFF